MSRSDLPFEPFIVPRVPPQKAAAPQPVDWFQELAPRLPVAAPSGPSSVAVERRAGERGAKALFKDVEEVAAQERQWQRRGAPEPPEIAALRGEAQAQAKALLQQARDEAESLYREAREQGYRDGQASGYADGKAQATEEVRQRAEAERIVYREDLAAFVAHIEAERQRAWEGLEPQIIGLAFDLAQQVIKQEVEASRTVALQMVRNALRRVANSASLRIRVHADDLDAIRANREDLLSLVDGIRHIEIIADRRVDRGGCVVETDEGSIDARIETQVREVGETLEQMISHPESEAA